jgi:putative membrane protein
MVSVSWHMHDMGAGWWVLMSLGWLLVWGLVVWAVVSLIRGRGAVGHDHFARAELDRRLAGGEISVGEYERLRDAMEPPARPAPSDR